VQFFNQTLVYSDKQWLRFAPPNSKLQTIHAPESRSSSPVRIPHDPISMEHVTIKGLYPCGEGAGYAGGIVSAALDGIKSAVSVLNPWGFEGFTFRIFF